MRYPPDQKDKSRQKILASASRLLRREGIAGVSVAALMQDAGLTHGGFYAHFRSKDELVAESVRHAMNETLGRLRDVAAAAPPGQQLAAVLQAYLSELHLRKPWGGCAVAQLCQEAARASPEVRQAMDERIDAMVAFLAGLMPQAEAAARQAAAEAAFAAMVGAIGLARALQSPAAQQHLLDATRRAILDAAAAAPQPRLA